MNQVRSARGAALYWRACLRWVLLGLAVVVVVVVGGDPLGFFGPGGRLAAVLRLLVSLPEQAALLLALAGFAGGFAVGRTRPPPEGSLRGAFIALALVTYALIALVDPLLLSRVSNDVLAADASRTPLGPELPWTIWLLRRLVVEEGLGGGGPITPLVRSQLYGFSFYFPFMVAMLGASGSWAGLLVGMRVAGIGRPAMERAVAWLVWLAQAGGFYVGIRVALALILYTGWTAERVALLPAGVPIIVAVVLAVVDTDGSRPASAPSRPGHWATDAGRMGPGALPCRRSGVLP